MACQEPGRGTEGRSTGPVPKKEASSKRDCVPLLREDSDAVDGELSAVSDVESSDLLYDKADESAKTSEDVKSDKSRNAIGDIAFEVVSSCESIPTSDTTETISQGFVNENAFIEKKSHAVSDTEQVLSCEDSNFSNVSLEHDTGNGSQITITSVDGKTEGPSFDTNKQHSGKEFGTECDRLCGANTGSPISDISEPELFQAHKNATSHIETINGKDSAYSESPSSEFSAASSIASCAEDSGITSTVRDEEMEEIPLADSRSFSPERFHEMSRLTTDEFVSSWVPKSLNTYAPNVGSKSSLSSDQDLTDSGNPTTKPNGIKALFSRSGNEGGQTAGWKLFGKVPPKEISKPQEEGNKTSFQQGSMKRRSFGAEASTSSSSKPKFLSLKRNSAAVPSSTTALIFENRPSNLPAKSAAEEKKHRQMYEAMVAEAKKKELRDKKRQEKEMKQKSKQEKVISSAACVWTSEILPNWESMKHSRKAKELWWQGLPPSVRGKIWKLAIGNDLQITYELFDIFQSHAYEKLMVTRNNRKKNKESGSVAELPTNDYPMSVVSSEHKVELIMLDVSRTFPSLCIFQEGGPFHDVLHSILGAYTCYRPDVGYVQGMSFIAAVLLLNLEPPDAFISFANLLNKPCQLAFFRVDHPMMKAYFATFEILLSEFLNKLHEHFHHESFSPDMYLIDWIFTLFSKSLPLDVACRVWDVFCRDGDDFLFRTALGILKFYQDDLLEMDFIHLGQFLTKLPDDIPVNNLFDCISSINLTKTKFNQILATQKELATQIKTVTASAK